MTIKDRNDTSNSHLQYRGYVKGIETDRNLSCPTVTVKEKKQMLDYETMEFP